MALIPDSTDHQYGLLAVYTSNLAPVPHSSPHHPSFRNMEADGNEPTPALDANVAQLRTEHMHSTRLLTEHYVHRINELEVERDRIREQWKDEVSEAKAEYEELSGQIEELTREKEELEEEMVAREEWELEKEQLEDDILRLKEGRERPDDELRANIKKEERLRTRIAELTNGKRSLKKRYNSLRSSVAKLNDDLAVANASIEEWRRKCEIAVEEKIDVIQRFAVRVGILIAVRKPNDIPSRTPSAASSRSPP